MAFGEAHRGPWAGGREEGELVDPMHQAKKLDLSQAESMASASQGFCVPEARSGDSQIGPSQHKVS